VSDWLAAAGQAAGGLASGVTGLLNIGFNRNAYWRQLEREDTAVQRRAKDMEAAGVNPLLAAGQPAQSTPQAQQKVPDLSGFGKGMEAMMNRVLLHKANTDISRTEAETRYTDEQTKGVEKRNALIDQEFGLKERGVSATEAANALRQAEIDIKKKYSDAQINQIYSTIERNKVLNSLSRDQQILTEANVLNLYSQMDYRDAQRIGTIIANEFTQSDFEKWNKIAFPRGGINGILSGVLSALGFQGGAAKPIVDDAMRAVNPGLAAVAKFMIKNMSESQLAQFMRQWTGNNSKPRTGATGSWDTPQSGSDRAAPMTGSSAGYY